jgi:4-hydroxy-2-oxoheptanedioate aldolase
MRSLPGFSLDARLRAGEVVHSGWCGLGSPIVAEMIARDGFHAVTLDAQHGLWDFGGMRDAIVAIRDGGAAAMVRVALNDFGTVSRLLDVGCEGVIAPFINNAADARAFAAVAKYPPLGERSFGPMRAMALTGVANPKDYVAQANDNIVALAMIETRNAVDNIEEIAATPGIDGLFLGPVDMSLTLSDGKTLDPNTPDVERVLDRILKATEKNGKIAGTYCFEAEHAAAFEKRGVRFFLIASDTAFLRNGTTAALRALRRS